MKDKHPIDDFFKSALSEHKTQPGKNVWEKIEAETGTGNYRGAAWYLLRAAVVVLMVSVGSWLFFNQTETNDNIAVNPDTEINTETDNPEPTNKKDQPEKSNEAEKERKLEQERKKQKVMPIMKNGTNNPPIYVQYEALPVEDDENELFNEDQSTLATVQLDPEQVKEYETPKLKVKMKFTRPVTEDSFYAENDTTGAEQPAFREKLYAYANNQWENIRDGKKVELPKAGKPKLQINLDKLLNN